MNREDLESLRQARRRLERMDLATRIAGLAGSPMGAVERLLPPSVHRRVHGAANAAIVKALDVSVSSAAPSAPLEREKTVRDGMYRALAAGTGAAGGFFGLYGLLVDLPVSTLLMLRSIVEIARHHGEEIQHPEARLACLEVFALDGGRPEGAAIGDASENGYFGLRLALAMPVTQAAQHISRHGLSLEGAPLLAHLARLVGARYGSVVSQRAAAQMVPVIGAVGGGALNLLFVNHFQGLAHAHFTVRKLERKYGPEVVRRGYEEDR